MLFRSQPQRGAPVEGLWFLRSDCDSALVAAGGNLVTDFRFHRATIEVAETDRTVAAKITVRGGDAQFRLNRNATPQLAAGAPFASLEEAAAFLKYKPFGLSPSGSDAVNVVRVVREEAAWRSRLVTVEDARWQFLARHETALEICCQVEPIDYQWERGKILRVALCASS